MWEVIEIDVTQGVTPIEVKHKLPAQARRLAAFYVAVNHADTAATANTIFGHINADFNNGADRLQMPVLSDGASFGATANAQKEKGRKFWPLPANSEVRGREVRCLYYNNADMSRGLTYKLFLHLQFTDAE